MLGNVHRRYRCSAGKWYDRLMMKRAWRKRYIVAENVLALLSMILLMVDDDIVVERTGRKVMPV
jgi:hypothetical protein